MEEFKKENGKIKHRVFRVSKNEIQLNVIGRNSFCETGLAIYHRRNHKDEWKVVIYGNDITIEVLELIHSYIPSKGRQYKAEEQTIPLAA